MLDTKPLIQGTQRATCEINENLLYLGTLYLSYRNNDKEQLLKMSSREIKPYLLEEERKELHPTYPQKPCQQEEWNEIAFIAFGFHQQVPSTGPEVDPKGSL